MFFIRKYLENDLKKEVITSMKKIVYMISALKNNGPNKVLLSMINGIDKSKYEVYVISFLNDNDLAYVDTIKQKVKEVFLINLNSKFDFLRYGVKKANVILKNINPDIIHSHGLLPDFVNSRLKTSAKRISTIHNNMFEDYCYSFGKLKSIFIIKWHLMILKKMDMCVCCSLNSYSILKKYISKITYIRNSVFNTKIEDKIYQKNRQQIREKYNIGLNDIVYIYAGNISKLKRSEDLVSSFDNTLNKNEFLFILGSGDLEQVIKDMVKNKNIIFVGFTKKVKEYMCASDIYTSFSSSEGFSISVLEALECNNLLLLSDIPSHKEMFTISNEYYIGEFFNSNNFQEMKTKVSKRVKKANYDSVHFVENKLSSKIMMEKYSKIYSK